MNTGANLSSHEAHSAVEQAAAWLARHRVGALSDADVLSFRDWLKASPDNAQAWDRHKRVWARLGDVADAPAILALREQTRTNARQYQLKRVIGRWGSALAACLIAGIAIWTWRTPALAPEPAVIRASAASELLTFASKDVGALPKISDISTRVGERALVQLADNSKVTLNTDSAIHVDFTGRNRSLTLLRGEAYFEVAKDKSRPFVVSAGSRQVIAVGTAFAVKLRQKQVQVNLVEGKVRVERISDHNSTGADVGPASDVVTLEAGTSLVAGSDGEQRIEALNVQHEVGWRSGKLVFAGDRLMDVVAEINRYSTQKIKLRDSALGDQTLSGVFDPAGGAEFARALESYGMVRIVDQDNSKIVLAAPGDAQPEN